MIHDAMMHWRGKNKNGENWILFFCVFLLFLCVVCVCVCVEREKNEVMRNTVFFFVSNQI